MAEIDLTPPAPVPVAGFVGRILEPYRGVNARCAARALTLATETTSVTILTADLLLIDRALARRVVERTGLAADQIYFTATHTHSGPGGWGKHPLERLVAGTYDPEIADHLADRLARVVLASRTGLQPAEAAFLQAEAPGLQRNRILPGQPTNDTVSAWVFRATGATFPGKVVATFVVFGAHATIVRPVPSRLGADYPGAFTEALRRRGDAGLVLFAAGTVGDAAPVYPPAPSHQKSAQTYGADLADRVAGLLKRGKFHREIDLINERMAVRLPPVQVPFRSASLRFSPLVAWWISSRTSHIHVLKVGPAFLAGFPGDIAGHLARRLRGESPIVPTSFNGDYKGYLVTRATFTAKACYETRWMSFFGPGLGEDLVDLARGRISSLDAPGR